MDAISRQDALDAIYKCTDIYINNLPVMIDKAETYKAISELPSAEPERKKGKWIYNQKRGTTKIWTCSECGWNDIALFNFCHNCGADMREN